MSRDRKGAVALRALLFLSLASASFAQQVRFPVVVLDREGRFIKNLNAGHFRLSENGAEQTLQGAEIDSGGVSLGVVADKSNSLRESGPALHSNLVQGLVSALDQSAPVDDFFVVTFSSDAFLACDFTRDPKVLIGAFEKEGFRGGTALWDGLYMGISHLQSAKNSKRAIFLVSDGAENNSRRKRSEVEDLLRHSGVHLFVFDLDPSREADMAISGVPLGILSQNSGGWYRQGYQHRDIGAYILWIRDFLRAQYTLSYTPTKPVAAGKWRKVKVQVTPPDGRKGIQIIAPAGYFAP